MDRDRDAQGRPLQDRPRDRLGRPLPRWSPGVPPLPDPLPIDPAVAVPLAQELLDAGRPFQAHEVLEGVWRTCPPSQRPLWQGLAQVAVAITHAARGNSRGAGRLLHRAAATLASAGRMDVPPLDRSAVDEWVAVALAADAADERWADRRLALRDHRSSPGPGGRAFWG